MGFLKEVCYNPSEFDIDVEENNCCVSNETGYIAFTYYEESNVVKINISDLANVDINLDDNYVINNIKISNVDYRKFQVNAYNKITARNKNGDIDMMFDTSESVFVATVRMSKSTEDASREKPVYEIKLKLNLDKGKIVDDKIN